MTPERIKINKEIGLLRRIVPLLEKYGALTHGLDVEEHLDLYREWLAEAISERETLPTGGAV